jgi:uncharacterized membrane protein
MGSSDPFGVVFFKKERILLFLKKKKQKDFCFWCWVGLTVCPSALVLSVSGNPGGGRAA